MALLELARLQDILQYPGLGNIPAEDHAFLLLTIRGVSRRAERYCNRLFNVEQRTQQFTIENQRNLIALPAYGSGTGTVASVHQSASRSFDSESLLDASSYSYDSLTGMLVRDHGVAFQVGAQTVQVVWSDGIANTPDQVPDDLRFACVLQSVFWWQRRKDIGIKSRGSAQGGDVTINESLTLIDEVREILDDYSRLS